MRIEIDLNGNTERAEYVIVKTDGDNPEKVWLNVKGQPWDGTQQAYVDGDPVNVSWVTLDKDDIRRVAGALMLLGDE